MRTETRTDTDGQGRARTGMGAGGLKAPFPYFGGKSAVAGEVWRRFGRPKQYIEPFCGSCAVLFGAPHVASLEVVNDVNGYIANFWRALKFQPAALMEWADYPVSHVDLGARHRWITDAGRTRALSEALQDAEWPGDAKLAGWWVWGQCAWIGSGWCDWFRAGRAPEVCDSGMGIHAAGQVPHASDAGRGIQAAGKVPHASDAGRGGWRDLLWALSARLGRVRIGHGKWDRYLNHHYGGRETAVFLDPPYRGFCEPYGAEEVADEVCAWAAANEGLRIALCGHVGDYDLPGWEEFRWKRGGYTYGSSKTTAAECIWFSPGCLRHEAEPLLALMQGRDGMDGTQDEKEQELGR